MTHPLIPQILDLAIPIANDLGLDVVDAAFQTNKRPPVLRIDIRNLEQDTSLDDCEKMSRALEPQLDSLVLIPTAYVLEVSSPGISRQLSSDRDFIAFKGFGVLVTSTEPYEGQQSWQGRLQGRDETHLHLSQKGRSLSIPRHLIAKVQLDSQR
ncbi:MAG: ribosome maturation factor RimP [Snowella sp.]|nr:ribosome maturation factor RimP [Snowella sp.]